MQAITGVPQGEFRHGVPLAIYAAAIARAISLD